MIIDWLFWFLMYLDSPPSQHPKVSIAPKYIIELFNNLSHIISVRKKSIDFDLPVSSLFQSPFEFVNVVGCCPYALANGSLPFVLLCSRVTLAYVDLSQPSKASFSRVLYFRIAMMSQRGMLVSCSTAWPYWVIWEVEL